MARIRRRFGPWSIAAALSVAIGGLVLLAVLAVLAVQLLSSRRNVVELLNTNMRETFEAIDLALDGHLAPAVDQIETLGRLIETGRIGPADEARFGDFLLGALAATPQVERILLLQPGDRLSGVQRRRDGSFESQSQRLAPNARRRRIEAEARATDGPVWGELVHLDGKTYINLRRGLHRDGAYIGLLALLISMPELSQLIATMGDERDATLFILHGKEHVLAHPALVSPHPDLNSEEPVVALDRVGDLVLAALPSGEPMEIMASLKRENIDVLRVEVAGKPYFVALQRTDDYGPTPWYLGGWAPLEDTMAAMHRLRDAAFVGLAIALAAVLLAVLLGRLLARPIRRVAAGSAKVSALDLGHVAPLPGSPIAELDEQARAFNAMLGGLRFFERYVPRRLVSRLIAGGAGDELDSAERQLTIMFTDIVSFTPMAERLPAGEVAAFLNDHFTLLARAVEAEDGTIDKYIGDALMAFWGAPDRQDDHALRACRAARAIAAAVAADNARRSAAGRPAVRLRIGLHSGPAVVGNIGAPGRINYTIVGDTVNTCQRLESLGREADRGDAVTILISETTAAAVAGDMAVEPVGRYPVKGRSAPVPVFRLLA